MTRNKSKKSFSKIKDKELTNNKQSKLAKSKALKNLMHKKVPQQKLTTPRETTAAKLLQKHSAKSRMNFLKAIPQTTWVSRHWLP